MTVASPVVVVLSWNCWSAVKAKDPVTWRVPVTFTVSQPSPVPAATKSPETFKHEEVTSQDPTTSPPQVVRLVALLQFVPLEVEPPTWLEVLVDPPEVCPEELELLEHAPHSNVSATMPTPFPIFMSAPCCPGRRSKKYGVMVYLKLQRKCTAWGCDDTSLIQCGRNGLEHRAKAHT